MAGFEEAEAPVLDERDASASELHLHQITVVSGTEQNDLLLQGDARLVVLENGLAHRLRLALLVRAGGQHRAQAAVLLGPQLLAISLCRPGNDRVGQIEDGPGRAVVLFERDGGGAREVEGELEDVPDGGGPEGVDGLGVVTHHREA